MIPSPSGVSAAKPENRSFETVMILENDMRATARAAGIAIFEDRLILEAQPPIDDATLAKIEQHCAGPVPEGLKALWAVSFGGRLDYDLRFEFEGESASFSFSEIFYPNSGAACDLWGWIAHEEERASENEDEPVDRRRESGCPAEHHVVAAPRVVSHAARLVGA